MNEEKKQVRYDPQGGAALTEAILALLNGFPGLAEGEAVAFATLGQTEGLAMFPGDGAVVERERRSVTGRVRQVCRYPFTVLLRAGGLDARRRADAKERLDTLGRWLGRQSVRSDGGTYRLEEYPALEEGRRFLDIAIEAPACLWERDEHQIETWAVGLTARYENIFNI